MRYGGRIHHMNLDLIESPEWQDIWALADRRMVKLLVEKAMLGMDMIQLQEFAETLEMVETIQQNLQDIQKYIDTLPK